MVDLSREPRTQAGEASGAVPRLGTGYERPYRADASRRLELDDGDVGQAGSVKRGHDAIESPVHGRRELIYRLAIGDGLSRRGQPVVAERTRKPAFLDVVPVLARPLQISRPSLGKLQERGNESFVRVAADGVSGAPEHFADGDLFQAGDSEGG